MNAEKKLGLAFVGTLSVAFCGVLTMRLLDANKAEQIDINVGPPVGSAPAFDAAKPDAKTDGAAAANVRPVAPAAPQPPETSRYADTGSRTAPKSGNYLPPLPKSPPSPAGDSRYGSTAAASASANPYGGASTNPSPAAPITNPYASTGSRYGTTASPTTPSAPPSFSNATPTAAATLTPTTTSSASPYGSSTASASTAAAPSSSSPISGAPSMPPPPSMSASTTSSTSAGGSGDNPLRSSRSFDSPTASGGGLSRTASTEPGLIGSGAATPNIPSAPTSTSSAADPYGGSRYGTTATPTAPASTSLASSGTREPRPFDASAVPSQPLSASAAPSTSGLNPAPTSATLPNTASASPTLPSASLPAGSFGAPSQGSSGFNSGFANTNSLRASTSTSTPTASPAGGFAPNTGNPAGSVAPAAATMPVAAPAVKNTPYVVQPDDNFWNISKKVYGDGSYYRALFAYNSDRYPHAEDVRAGSVLDVPPAEALKQRYPELLSGAVGVDGRPTDASLSGGRPAAAAATSYTVREGDTLFDIARRQLGRASRWNEIYELNRAALGENLENLRPGMQIQLPQ